MDPKKTQEDIMNFMDIEELEEKIPVFVATRMREQQPRPDLPTHEVLPVVYGRLVRNNVLMDAVLFLETRKGRPLVRYEADKVRRLVDDCLHKFRHPA